MTQTEILQYIHGALLMGCFVIGLKFLKYWSVSRDRFFIFLTGGFWVFGLGWGLRTLLPAQTEHAHLAYVPRLLAFLLILIAIFEKNRSSANE